MKEKTSISLKLFAFLMSFLILVVSLPSYAFATLIRESSNESEQSNSEKTEVIVLEEEKSLRDENVKHFKLSDGSTKAVVYSQAVHYLDENGAWIDIDNALTINGSEYTTNNKTEIKFANKSGSNGLVSIKDEEYKIDFTPLNTNKVSVVIENPQKNDSRKFEDMSVLDNLVSKAIYADIYDGIDIEYILVGNNIKENIIVKEKQDSYTFSFELKLNKLSAELKDGAIILSNYDTGDVVYEIPAPYMFDANNEYSNSVEYSLVQDSKWKYTFTVTADAEWINSDDRAFPVTIDPAINVNKASIVEDTSIESMFPDDCAGSYTLVCAGGSMTTYWKTNQLPNIPQNAHIIDASFSLTYHSSNCLAITYLSLYEVISDWDEETFNYSEYISGRQGQRSSNIIGYTDISEIYKEVYAWDVIELVNKWYQNPNVNFGLAIGEENPTLDENKYRFYSSEGGDSSNRPTLTITYLQTKGIEAYWSYVSQNAGLAGVGNVSLSAGNLVLSKETLTTTDNIFGFSPVLTYDSNMAGKPYNYNNAQIANSIAFTPYGFKLNANETLIKKEAYDGQMCYIWSDSDGTEHNFFPSLDNNEENIWYDDSGLQLRIELDETNDICYMFDSGNNKRIFKNKNISFGAEVLGTYYLSGVMDKNGNELRFYLENNNKPVKISLLPNGSSVSIDILHIAYNSSGNICSVWNKQSGQAVVLRYSNTSTGVLNATGGAYLREIIYLQCSDSIEQDDLYSFIGDLDNQATGITVYGAAKYEYDSNGYLISAQDTKTGYIIDYHYTNGKVTRIYETGITSEDSETGQQLGITYHTGYTEVRTSGNDDIYGTNDDIIGVYTFDNNGRVISTFTTNVDRTEIYGATSGEYVTDNEKAKNSLKQTTSHGIVSPNYLLNGNFEKSGTTATYWNTSANASVIQKIGYDALDNRYLYFNLTQTTSASATQAVYLAQSGDYTLFFDMYSAKEEGLEWTVKVTNSNGTVVAEKNSPINASRGAVGEYTDSLQFEIQEAGTYVVSILVENSSASSVSSMLYVDNVMLSKSIGKVAYNDVLNSSFDYTITNADGTSGTLTLNRDEVWYVQKKGENGTVNIPINSSIAGNIGIYNSGDSYFGRVLKINGGMGQSNQAFQDVYYQSLQSSTDLRDMQIVTVSGYAKINNAIRSNESNFALVAYYKYVDSDRVFSESVPFNIHLEGWQYASGNIPIEKNRLLEYFVVGCEYSNNIGSAYFDNICVTHDEFETTIYYEYNEDGKVESQKNGQEQSFYAYNENGDITHVITPNGKMVETLYENTNNPYQVTQERVYDFKSDLSSKEITTILESATKMRLRSRIVYTYNQYGLITKTEAISVNQYGYDMDKIVEETTYHDEITSKIFGAVKTVTNGFGETTRYFYDSKYGYVLAEIYLDNTGLHYTYDEFGCVLSVQPVLYVQSNNSYTVQENSAEVEYTYNDQNRLNSISSGSTTYTLGYDIFGNNVSISVGSTQLISQTTNNANGKLSSISYADGSTANFVYDKLERLIEATYTKNNVEYAKYTYEYYSNGNLYKIIDTKNKKALVYEYDLANNITGIFRYNTETMKIDGSNYYYYDEKQRLEESRFNYDYRIDYNTNAFTSVYVAYRNSYNEDNTLKAYSLGFFDHYGKYRISYTYDDFNRLSEKNVEINELKPESNNDKGVLSTIEYAYKTENGVTSALIEEYLTTVYYKTGSDHIVSAIEQWNYVYDSVGNIIAVKNDDIDVVSYEYDSLGQLTRENNVILGKTYTYSYDNYGNLISVKTYGYTTGALTGTVLNTDTYTYSNGDWGDQLVSFNGQTITYDQMGNPTTYLGATLSWENIRQLASYVKGNTNVSYTYNADGIRTSKTVNGVTHTYALEGTCIHIETYGTVLIVYLYDEAGSPIGLAYRDSATADTTLDKEEQFTYYLFTKNLQGDIIGIYNEDGQQVAEYQYDAWGNCTTLNPNGTENTNASFIGNINPFRYRGYYYDTDTGFYYLNSRYYDPQVKRFINADDISYLGANGDMQGFNLYAYCSNNPVIFVDPAGHSVIVTALIVGAIIGACIGFGATTYVDYADDGEVFNGSVAWYDYLGATATGGILGGVIGAGIGYIAPTIGSFMGSTFTLGSIANAGGELIAISVSGAQIMGVGLLGELAILFSLGASRYKPKDTRSNNIQNEEFKRICDEYDLNQTQRDRIHHRITKKGFSVGKIRELIEKLYPYLRR